MNAILSVHGDATAMTNASRRGSYLGAEANGRLTGLRLLAHGLAFDPVGGAMFNLSNTGALVIAGLREGQGTRAIANDLAARFDVRRETAERDVALFLTDLVALGLWSDSSGEG
jgi:hypothetical protein